MAKCYDIVQDFKDLIRELIVVRVKKKPEGWSLERQVRSGQVRSGESKWLELVYTLTLSTQIHALASGTRRLPPTT